MNGDEKGLLQYIYSGEVKTFELLRFQHVDKYNQETGNVDLADQLRGTYILDKSIRNRNLW